MDLGESGGPVVTEFGHILGEEGRGRKLLRLVLVELGIFRLASIGGWTYFSLVLEAFFKE